MTRGSTRSTSTSDADETEKLITRVCTNFADQMDAKFEAKISKLDDKLSSLIDSLKNLEAVAAKNNHSIRDMQLRLDNLEQNCKQNCLRICGLSPVEDDNMAASVVSFIVNKLNISCSPNDIDFVYRIKNTTGNKSDTRSTLLVRFLSNMVKSRILAAKKKLKGTSVVIFEDLTRSRYDLLIAARQKHGKNAWSAGGKIYYWDSVKNCKVLITHRNDV